MSLIATYQLVTAADVSPVTLEEAKAELRMEETTDFDNEVEEKVLVATEEIEEECRLQFINATWKLILDQFPPSNDCGPGEILIEKCPVSTITSIAYVATDGTTTTLSASGYRTDLAGLPARIQPAFGLAWPATRKVSNAVTVTFVAGYGNTASSVPARGRMAIKSRARELFEGCDEAPFTAQLKTSLKWGDGWRRSASDV